MKVFNDINEYLSNKYWMVFAFSELSRSRRAYHFYFFFDVKEKNEKTWFKCKEISIGIIREAFVQCGYKKELNHFGVYDTCTNSPVQCIYITKINSFINKSCIGDYSMIDLSNLMTERLVTRTEKIEHQNKIREKRKNKTFKYNVTIKDPENVEYIPHSQRWSLFCSLSVLFKDDKRLKSEWERCSKLMVEDNGHNTEYYMKVPYELDWYRNLTGDETMNIRLLNMFGYYVTVSSKIKTKLPSFL